MSSRAGRGQSPLSSVPFCERLAVGGLRPILDLRPINRALYKPAFKKTTLKQILAQIRPEDWFISVDLKDAYFHTPRSQVLYEILN